MEKGICTRYEKPGWTPTRTRCSARHRERRLPLARAATSHNILGLPGFALAAEAEKPTSALHIDPNQSGFRASPPRSSQPSAAGSSSPSQRPLRTRRSGAWPAGRSPAPRLLTPGRLRGGASRREGASQVPGGGGGKLAVPPFPLVGALAHLCRAPQSGAADHSGGEASLSLTTASVWLRLRPPPLSASHIHPT